MKSTKIFHPKNLTKAVGLGLVMMCAQQAMATDNGSYKNIGDLEIYKAAEGGSVTITMMLDISGSMQATDSFCTAPIRANSTSALGTRTYYLKDEAGNPIREVTRADGSKIDTSRGVKLVHQGFSARASDGKTYWYYCDGPTNRMEKLKQAVLELVSQEGTLSNDLKLGLGTFPTSYNWYTGQIAIPAKPLTREQRWEIMRYISALFPLGSTPSAQAYVEAGAYMLGTTTAKLGATRKEIITVGSMNMEGSGGSQALKLLYCASSSTWGRLGTNPSTGATVVQAINNTFSTFTHNGETYNWYSCNDGSNRTFPPFDHNIRTQSSSWRATIVPDMVGGLDYNLLPEFDFVYGNSGTRTGAFPLTPMTNATAPKTADGWRNSYRQFADLGYHFGRVIEYRIPSINNSGFPLSSAKTKKPDGNTYQSPIVTKEGEVGCDGYGIYFLTDGEPNGANTDARLSANLSLGKDGGQYGGSSNEFPDSPTYGAQGYWNMIGAYAKDLREGNNNLNVSIKTATVGFGSVFTPTGGTPTTTKMVDGKEIQVVDCDKLGTIDARNLCRWGERGYGYGEGGFLATSDATAVANSVVNFAKILNQTIPSSPSGTIAVPTDPLSDNNIQPFAYLPMLEAQVDKAVATWPGNLKKYDTVNGTLQGANGARLYVRGTGATTGNENFPYATNSAATDKWQRVSSANNSQINVGGTYERLKNVAPTQRTLYVETVVAGKRQLVKVGVTAAKKLVGFDQLGPEYTAVDKAYILNYLGYNVSVDPNSYTGSTAVNTKLEQLLSNASTYATPVLGAVMHSVPTLVTYNGQFRLDTGLVNSDSATREDYLLYGSMDGALHMVDDDTGAEKFGFIPRAMFDDENQRRALLVNATGTKGQPVFGVDAPWITKSEYTYNYDGLSKTPVEPVKISAEKIYAYGGLRMGGVGFYGLDVTSKDDPKLLFSINDKTSGFERLGQTWSKPLVAKIRTGAGRDDYKDVLVFGGGYDMCYENPRFTLKATDIGNTDASCNNKETAKGNAIYMVDASDGSLIASWSTKEHADLKHSIVSEITGLDRNNNGFIDHLYFGDLGGQLFRIDLNEGTSNENAIKRRVVKVFDANAENANKGRMTVKDENDLVSQVDVTVPFRFYTKPLVSFYDVETPRLPVVNISTGDRSNPLSRLRGDKSYDRVYGIFDRDLSDSKLSITGDAAKNVELSVQDLTDKDLTRLDGKEIETSTDRPKILADIKGSKGWFYELNRFDGKYGVPHVKSVGNATVTASRYIMSVYNPDYKFSSRSSCEAGVEGGTERQMYCLPWGVCMTDDGVLTDGSLNGTLGFIKVGPGLQEMATGTLTSRAGQSTRYSTILGMQTIQEAAAANKNRGTGTEPNPALKTPGGQQYGREGGDILAVAPIMEENRSFERTHWYSALQDEGQ